MAVHVRALASDEGNLLRRVRLRALTDSPDSFATALDAEQALTDADWASRVAGADATVFVAFDDAGEPLAMAGARPHPEEPDAIGLWGMWVAPQARGTGLGRRLVEAGARWAAVRGASRLRLGVMADVPASVAFYERLGFTRDDPPQVFRRDPARRWLRMYRPL